MFLKKQIFQLNVLKKLLSEEHSCVTLIPTTRMLALPPCFLNDIKKGIFFMLNKALKKYDQHLDGILIGYQNVKILMDDRTGLIPMGVADIRVNVSIEFYVFQPKIGGLLKGVVNKKSSSHIGCLVHKYFNASILKPDDIEFEDWDCKDINVDDHIEFRVSDLDFTGFMPIIEGVINKSDSKDGSALGQINNHIISNDISNSDEIEKELLNSDEFWSKKLNSGNWVPEMNFEDSQTNSRKRTYSDMSSLAKESDNNIDKNKNIVDDDEGDGDENLHRKKKRKKNKEFLGESINELPTENLTKYEKKNSVVEKKLNNEKSPHKTERKRENEERGTDDPDFGTCARNHFDSENTSFEDLLVSPGKKRRKSSETTKEKISESERLSSDSFEGEKIRLSSGKKKKMRKEKSENASDLEPRPKSSGKKDDKKSNRPIDKQSESDSGVGLEGLRSPILFKPSSSTKKKSEDKTDRKGKREYSEEGFGSSEELKSDTSVLQMSLLKEAMKSCQWKERSRLSEKEKNPGKIWDSSEKKTPRSSKTKKTDRHSNATSDRISSPKPKPEIMEENDESEDLRRSLSRQMMQDLKMKVGEKEETPCRSHKKKKKKDSSVKRELLGMFEEEKTGKEVEKKKESEPNRSDRGETTRDDSYEKLLVRLSCEQRLSLGVKEEKERNDYDDYSTKAKRKKKKDGEKEEKKNKKRTKESGDEAKEKTDGVDDNFSSLYSKLLQDALCSINGTDDEEELNGSYLKMKKDGISKKMKRESCESESSSGKIETKEEKKHKKKKSLKDMELNLSAMSHEPAETDSRKKEKKKKKDKEKKNKTDKIEGDDFRYGKINTS